MMGQQQIVAEQQAGGALRPIVLALTVAALMTVITAIAAGAASAETKPQCYYEPSTDEQVCDHITTPKSGGKNVFVHSKDDETGPANPDEGSVTHTDTTGHTVTTPSGNRNTHGHVNGNK